MLLSYVLKKEWSNPNRLYNEDMLLIGNDIVACPIIEIGTMKIKMLDEVVRVLGGIRTILDLNKNLMSFLFVKVLSHEDCHKCLSGNEK